MCILSSENLQDCKVLCRVASFSCKKYFFISNLYRIIQNSVVDVSKRRVKTKVLVARAG